MWDEANSGFPQDFENLGKHLALWKHNACLASIFVIGSKIMRSCMGNENQLGCTAFVFMVGLVQPFAILVD
jgi:hypothetical protein